MLNFNQCVIQKEEIFDESEKKINHKTTSAPKTKNHVLDMWGDG